MKTTKYYLFWFVVSFMALVIMFWYTAVIAREQMYMANPQSTFIIAMIGQIVATYFMFWNLFSYVNLRQSREWFIRNRHSGIIYSSAKGKRLAKIELRRFSNSIAARTNVPLLMAMDDYILVVEGKRFIKPKHKYEVVRMGEVGDIIAYTCMTAKAAKAYIMSDSVRRLMGEPAEMSSDKYLYRRAYSKEGYEVIMSIVEMIASELYNSFKSMLKLAESVWGIIRAAIVICISIVMALVTVTIIFIFYILRLIKDMYNEITRSARQHTKDNDKGKSTITSPEQNYPGQPYDHV